MYELKLAQLTLLSHLLNQLANDAGARFATMGIDATPAQRNEVINRYYAMLAACGQVQTALEATRTAYLAEIAAGQDLKTLIDGWLVKYDIAAPMQANSPLDPNEPIFYTDDRGWISESVVNKLGEVTQ